MRLAVSVTRIGTLSSNVFERRTSKGSEPFPPLKYLDATKFVLLSFKSVTSPLPVYVRRSRENPVVA